jgi:coproporphyrinogen III oxidase
MENMVINRTWHGGGADATPFYEKGVSTLYFATKNSYTHLHLLSDKPNTINKELHQYITRLIYKTASEMAQ